jgi:hypothetical protein
LILETADGFEVEDELSFSVYVSNTEEPSFLVKKKCDTTEPHPTPSVENSPSDGAKEKVIQHLLITINVIRYFLICISLAVPFIFLGLI